MDTKKYVVSAKLIQSEGEPISERIGVEATGHYEAIGKATKLFWETMYKTESRFANVKEFKIKGVYLDF